MLASDIERMQGTQVGWNVLDSVHMCVIERKTAVSAEGSVPVPSSCARGREPSSACVHPVTTDSFCLPEAIQR